MEHGDRRRVAGSAIHHFADGGESPLDLYGRLFVADQDGVPIGEPDLPQQYAVVRVAGHQRLFARQRRVFGRLETELAGLGDLLATARATWITIEAPGS